MPRHLMLSIGLIAGCVACSDASQSAATHDVADAGSTSVGSTDASTPFINGVGTFAGSAEPGSTDGDRSIARFANPVSVLRGADGKLYVADFDNARIRVVDADGNVTTLISRAGFARPFALAFASDGTLYVSTDSDDTGACSDVSGTVWRVDVRAMTATVVARDIGRPRGLAVLPDGSVAVADVLHHVVSILDPKTARMTTLAGALDESGYVDGVGGVARFAAPYGIALRADGNLVVCDSANDRVRVVSLDGAVTTLAGTGHGDFADGPLPVAMFNRPQAIAIDRFDEIFVTDADNFRVRRISGGVVETIAGDGTGGYRDDSHPMSAELYGLQGITLTPDGSMLFVADGNRGQPLPFNRVRLVALGRPVE